GTAEEVTHAPDCETWDSQSSPELFVQCGSNVFNSESVSHSNYPGTATHKGHPGTLQRTRSNPHE
ncbi:hypothetical protein M9458_046895, partial [Cirrhinus mrigala]